MQLSDLVILRLSGVLAIVGALLYALSDVLLIAYEVGPREAVPDVTEADIKPYVLSPLSARDYIHLAALPASRLAWGGLLGVMVTPLVIAGLWPMYYAMRPAGPWLALAPTLPLAFGLIIAAFVHGSFIYLEQNGKVLISLSAEDRSLLGPTFRLQQKVVVTAYAVIGVAMLAGSLLFTIVVASFDTLLPRWMAAVNPLTATLAWLLLKRVLPREVTKYTEGAGFNIGFILFFSILTIVLW